MDDDSLYLQLQKLSGVPSEENLDRILTTLWKTRRTGLRSPEKSQIQSLVNLPSPPDLDPVLACLRSLIRKCVHGAFPEDDVLKLLPPGVPVDLQTMLVAVLEKRRSQWKEEMDREQHTMPRTSISYQVKASLPPSFTSFPSSGIEALLWPRYDDPGTSTPLLTDSTASQFAHSPGPRNVGPPDNLRMLPRLKSMAWTMENRNGAPANRVAIISLKLQDYTKSSSGEMEVKFQLNRDTLEAMLRSLTYINEQLSGMAATSLEPRQKKQKL